MSSQKVQKLEERLAEESLRRLWSGIFAVAIRILVESNDFDKNTVIKYSECITEISRNRKFTTSDFDTLLSLKDEAFQIVNQYNIKKFLERQNVRTSQLDKD